MLWFNKVKGSGEVRQSCVSLSKSIKSIWQGLFATVLSALKSIEAAPTNGRHHTKCPPQVPATLTWPLHPMRGLERSYISVEISSLLQHCCPGWDRAFILSPNRLYLQLRTIHQVINTVNISTNEKPTQDILLSHPCCTYVNLETGDWTSAEQPLLLIKQIDIIL